MKGGAHTNSFDMSDIAKPQHGVCLVVMLRNKAHVVVRMLRSVWDVVDAWCCVDTGSTDGTQSAVQEFVATHPKPGVYVHQTWRHNYGANRTAALAEARVRFRHVKWLWLMDARDVFHGPVDWDTGKTRQLPLLVDAAAWSMMLLVSDTLTARALTVFKRDEPWTFVGVACDAPQCARADALVCLSLIHI